MKITKKGRVLTLLLAVMLLVSCGESSVQELNKLNEPTKDLVRTTTYGPVKGIQQEGALEWLGIPYGGSTAGENRWKAPTEPDKWESTLLTTEPGEEALQMTKEGISGGENALNLDVYRPNTKKKNLPVMVYLHGGNNQTSNAQEIPWAPFVDKQGVVAVSLNYRLGVLGFNPLLALKDGTDEENSGNFTLLDIHQGLQWVRKNIAAFGGDKNNITVSGFSAGGRDIMAMLISPLFKDDFDKAAVFSGGLTLAQTDDSQVIFAKAFAPLVLEDGIKGTQEEAITWLLSDKEEVRNYLYSLDGERMAALMKNAGIRMDVFPHLYIDGTVIPSDGFDTTAFNDVPLWLLSGEQEFSLFALSDPYFANKDLNTDETAKTEYNFVNKYGGHLYSLFNVKETATKISSNYKSDIYAMEILFGEDAKVVGEPMSLIESFHGVFVPLFNKDKNNYINDIGTAYNEAGAQEMSSLFGNYLFAFMKNGKPTAVDLTTWEKWELNKAENTLFLNADLEKATAVMGEKRDTIADVLNAMDADTTITAEQKQILILTVLNRRWFSSQLDERYGINTPFDTAA